MLGFYLDQNLTKPVSAVTPKRFLVPTKGGKKTTSLWLGDPDANITYVCDQNLAVRPYGPAVSVALKQGGQQAYNFPGTPVLFNFAQFLSGVANAKQIDLQVGVDAGDVAEFADWGLESIGVWFAENYARYSDNIGQAAPWGVVTPGNANLTVTLNAATAPDGTNHATYLKNVNSVSSLSEQLSLNGIVATADIWSAILWMKAADAAAGTSCGFGLYTATGWQPATAKILSGPGALQARADSLAIVTGLSTTQWTKVMVTFNAAQTPTSINIYPGGTSAQNGSNHVWGLQVFRGSVAIPYSAVTNATISAPVTKQKGPAVLQAPCYLLRRDQALPQHLRTLPLEREVTPSLPGFKIGEYRWRDENTVNAKALVPTKWDPDVDAIGIEKFIAGIGHNRDLEPQQLEEVNDSLPLRIKRGHYFTGPKGYFLPAQPRLEFFPAHEVNHRLPSKPVATLPVFVGTWRLDGQGFYEKDTEYRYKVTAFDGEKQFALDRKSLALTLSEPLPSRILFLGLLSGNATDYFDVPIYPVDKVKRVYIDRGLADQPVACKNFAFDGEQGTLTLTKPAGGLAGEPVFAEVDPAVAVLYDEGTDDSRLLPVDVNPAFAGITSGYVYLQHRRQKANSITLACDKPMIAIPATHQSIIGLIAYGPVYFDGDYALLIATAYSKVAGEPVPNARLRVKIDPNTFTGLINYKDPLSETIEVVTGGDGTANLVFVPKAGWGTYIPTLPAAGSDAGIATTTLANDTVVLPAAVPISQVRNDSEGWLVTAYSVFNNNPLFGRVGGDPTLGEIVWRTTGTAGKADYKTNGMRDAWRVGQTLIRPIKALDANGKNYNEVGFTGTVKKLVFGQAVPSGATIGAYFLTYVQRVTVQLQAADSNVISNTILLEMAVPSVIVENPWLVLNDDLNGRLNQYRLGWQPQVPTV